MKVTVDYKRWLKQFEDGAKKAEEASLKTFSSVVTQVYNQIVDYTPVGNPSLWKYPAHSGYVPGTLKQSWALELSPKNAIISNDQPYASRVEYGWSSQAPQGMMRRALSNFSNLLNAAAVRYKI